MKLRIPLTAKFFLIVLALCSCKHKDEHTDAGAPSADNNEKVNTKVILQVGAEKFTAFEMQKNFTDFKQKFTQKFGRDPQQQDINLWANDFVERAYVLADARDRGYYNRTDVQHITNAMAAMMLSQSHGLVDNKLMANVTAADVDAAAAKQPGRDRKTVEALLKQSTLFNYREKIKVRAATKTDPQVLAVLSSALAKYQDAHEVKKADIPGILSSNIATYRGPNNKIETLSVTDFINYYNNMPIRRFLRDSNAVKSYIDEMAANAYITADAGKMGITDDPKFVLGKKNFTDNLVYRKYQEEHMTDKPNITADEINNIYNAMKSNLLRPAEITYSVFTCASTLDAAKTQRILQTNPTDTASLLNTLSQKRHIKLDDTHTGLTDTLRKMLIRMHTGESSYPVKTNDYYTILFVESASGTKPLAIDDVRPYLTAIALEKRRDDSRHAYMPALRKKYQQSGTVNVGLLSGI